LFERKGKFHEIYGRKISTNVSESFGSGRGRGWDCLYRRESFVRFLAEIFLLLSMENLEVVGVDFAKKGKFHEIFGRNISIIGKHHF
jgi:hypothetical protein